MTWKRVCELFVASTGSPGKKNGSACVECLSRRRAAQEKNVNARSRWSPWCHANKKKRHKRVVGLLATWTSGSRKKDGNVSSDCSPCRQANPENDWVACKVDMRLRKERWKRVRGLFVASTRGPGKKSGSALNKMDTCVRAARRASMRSEENCERVVGLLATWPSGPGKNNGSEGLKRSPYRRANHKKNGNASVGCMPSRHAA